MPTVAYLVRAWLKQGNLAEAKRVLETAVTGSNNQPGFWVELVKIAQARLFLAKERCGEAESLLVAVWETAVAHNRMRNQFEISLLQAVDQQNLSQPDAAQNFLEEAVMLARPSGEIRLFLDESQAIQPLLNKLQFDDVAMQAYKQKLLDAFPKPQTSHIEDANQQLGEPLTKRELELLALIVAGTTNREIAEQLFISYGTVRRHLNNIYGKLGVNGRTQAILKAQVNLV